MVHKSNVPKQESPDFLLNFEDWFFLFSALSTGMIANSLDEKNWKNEVFIHTQTLIPQTCMNSIGPSRRAFKSPI